MGFSVLTAALNTLGVLAADISLSVFREAIRVLLHVRYLSGPVCCWWLPHSSPRVRGVTLWGLNLSMPSILRSKR